MFNRRKYALSLGILFVASFCVLTQAQATVDRPKPGVNPKLAAHQKKFLPARVEKVTDRIYFAIGYDLGNMVFVEGDDSVIVIDTLWMVENAAKARDDFVKLCDKPIKTVIYTHSHADHTGGVRALVPEGQEEKVKIIANRRWTRYVHEKASAKAPHINLRALYQIGLLLPLGPEGTVGTGVGAPIRLGTVSFIPPTQTVDQKLDLSISGVRMKLIYAPCDLDDSVAVWFPDDKVMYTADALCGVLPAISTPRYEQGRDVTNWVDSIDKLMEYPVEDVLPGHGPRVSGREAVQRVFRNTRDMAQFVRDQTIRYMNMNLSPDQVVARIKLPPHIAADPELGEHYHRLSWMIRGVYMKNAGWFGGDTVEMVKPLAAEEAPRMVELAGGKDKLLRAAEEAYRKGDHGWAAQLATYLIRAFPDMEEAKQVKANALRSIAYNSISANERHYLLTEALVLEGALDIGKLRKAIFSPDILEVVPVEHHFRNLGVRLNPDKCLDVVMTVHFHITDLDEHHTIIVRRGVSQYKPGKPAKPELTTEFDKGTLFSILSGKKTWRQALKDGSIEVSSREKFGTFLTFYDL